VPRRWPSSPASMLEWGWTDPILVGADDDIIAGRARLMASWKLGMTEVPVIGLSHLSAAQRRALVMQLALHSGWDEESATLNSPGEGVEQRCQPK